MYLQFYVLAELREVDMRVGAYMIMWLLRYVCVCLKGCPNKCARFKVRATVILLGWRQWQFNVCHLSLMRLVVMECYTKEQCVVIVKTHYKYGESYAEIVRKVSSHAMAIRIGHRGRAIWHHVTSFFGGLWNLVSMPTNYNPFLSSRRRFDVSLAKLSHNYAEMSSRISSKEKESAIRVMGDICRILCTTINRSLFTLYWNKNISTFWINGAFYYKIKSRALVGTLYTSVVFILPDTEGVCKSVATKFCMLPFHILSIFVAVHMYQAESAR
jgi:hypothetical protein